MADDTIAIAENIRRLRWQCRRGIKEVEVLLIPFFEQQFSQLNGHDQLLFEKLLSQHDVDMFEWFTHRSKPDDPELAAMVVRVMNLGQARSE